MYFNILLTFLFVYTCVYIYARFNVISAKKVFLQHGCKSQNKFHQECKALYICVTKQKNMKSKYQFRKLYIKLNECKYQAYAMLHICLLMYISLALGFLVAWLTFK